VVPCVGLRIFVVHASVQVEVVALGHCSELCIVGSVGTTLFLEAADEPRFGPRLGDTWALDLAARVLQKVDRDKQAPVPPASEIRLPPTAFSRVPSLFYLGKNFWGCGPLTICVHACVRACGQVYIRESGGEI
jgi:hypothetical protein